MRKHIDAIKAALFIGPLMSLGGCMEYTIETTLHADGSGERVVQLEVKDAGDRSELGLSAQDFRSLMFVTEGQGWDHHTQVDSGDTTNVFRRERRVTDLGSWSKLNDDVRISGSLPSRSSETIGYLTLGDVQFRNRVLVGQTTKSDGNASFNYVETFLWENALEAIIEVMVAELDKAFMDGYPNLSDRARGEILGFGRARFWEAAESGVFDENEDDWDLIWESTFERVAAQALKVVREGYPNAEDEDLRERTDLFSGILDERTNESFEGTFPGLDLSFSAEISFRLTMPGEVTSTNAHERDGNILVWTFGPGDAMRAPVLLVAESVVGG